MTKVGEDEWINPNARWYHSTVSPRDREQRDFADEASLGDMPEHGVGPERTQPVIVRSTKRKIQLDEQLSHPAAPRRRSEADAPNRKANGTEGRQACIGRPP